MLLHVCICKYYFFMFQVCFDVNNTLTARKKNYLRKSTKTTFPRLHLFTFGIMEKLICPL